MAPTLFTPARRLVAGLVLAASLASGLAGCYGTARAYEPEAFASQRVRTIAVLPILNDTSVNMPLDGLQATINAQLALDKRYAVVPTAIVAARLSQGPGALAFRALTDALNLGEAVPAAVYGELARVLEADAVLLERVQALHQLQEQGLGASMAGGAYASNTPVAIAQLSGEVWARGVQRVVWRQDVLERGYPSSQRSGESPMTGIVAAATRSLLSSLPENTWAPVSAPAPKQ